MTGIIILAAGSSSRLGIPKQNLIYDGKTLLQRVIETVLLSDCEVGIVILGANAEVIRPTIDNTSVRIIYNHDWQEGIASSIRSGITDLQHIEQQIDAVILMLCDQPFADTSLVNQLIQTKSQKGIVACAYSDTTGAPVLFDKKYFDELLLLKGQEGAKKLLLKYPKDVITIPFPLGSIDIDTLEDYKRLKRE